MLLLFYATEDGYSQFVYKEDAQETNMTRTNGWNLKPAKNKKIELGGKMLS